MQMVGVALALMFPRQLNLSHYHINASTISTTNHCRNWIAQENIWRSQDNTRS